MTETPPTDRTRQGARYTMSIEPAKDHDTVVADLIAEGTRAVWADKVDVSLRPALAASRRPTR